IQILQAPEVVMRRSLWSPIALVAALAGLLAVESLTAAPAKPSTRTTRTARATRVTPRLTMFKGQVSRRRAGAGIFVVQARVPGSFKTPWMTLDSAVVARARLRAQGFSGHIHNFGLQGSLVHYGMSHWRSRALFTNSVQANQAATILRATGLHARVVRR